MVGQSLVVALPLTQDCSPNIVWRASKMVGATLAVAQCPPHRLEGQQGRDKPSPYCGVKNAGVHATCVPETLKLTSTVVGTPRGWRPWRESVKLTYPPASLTACLFSGWSFPWK